MTLSNEDYLEAYVAWKDKVNTEDVDTPERFRVHLQALENERILEAAREEFSSAMETFSYTNTEYTSSAVREAFIPVAEALELDTTWWKPNKKLEALAAKPSVFVADNGKVD